MIANLKTTSLLVAAILLVGTAMGKNHFQQIAAENNIHPFEFQMAYPLWYKWDERPIRGIIYLSNEAEYLQKLDGRTYFGQPTVENAEVIANFSAEPIDIALYYVIVDSNVAQHEMNMFLEKLAEDDYYIDVRFVGVQGNYVEMRYENEGHMLEKRPVGCYLSAVTSIFINSLNGILLESERVKINEIAPYYKLHYGHNLPGNHECIECPMKHQLHVNRSLNYIDYLKEKTEKEPNNDWLEKELLRYRKVLELTVEYSPLYEMSRSYRTTFKMQRYTSLNMYFKALGQVQHGIFLARNEYAKKRWQKSYYEIIKERNMDLLMILVITFPDNFVYLFNSRSEWIITIESAPPPPEIEPGTCWGTDNEMESPKPIINEGCRTAGTEKDTSKPPVFIPVTEDFSDSLIINRGD